VENVMQQEAAPRTHGLVIDWAARYDLLAWLLTHGRERQLRERFIVLAGLAPADAVLDIGCGTGTLGIAARRHVGPSGTVCGIDASPPMIARARRKAYTVGRATSAAFAICSTFVCAYPRSANSRRAASSIRSRRSNARRCRPDASYARVRLCLARQLRRVGRLYG
jgi:SAM-dependent methyltransferase